MSSITGYNPATVSTALTAGTYRHVALSISGTVHTLYLDGSMVAQNIAAGNVFASYTSAISNVFIGCASDLSYGLTGSIDDFKIWNRVLPPTDISAIYYSQYIPFTPASIAGLRLWLDATVPGIISGTTTSSWPDKSGYNNNLLPGSGSTGITLGNANIFGNNKPYVYFNPDTNNAAGMQLVNLVVINMPMTYFIVVNGARATSYDCLLISIEGGVQYVINTNQLIMQMYGANVGVGASSNSANYPTTGTNPSTNGLHLIMLQSNGSGKTVTSYYGNIDGTNVINTITPSTGGQYGTPTGTTKIFSYNGMHVCEALYYQQSLLSQSDYQQVEGYLAWKWGIQGNLPTTHPYKTAAPSTYSNYSAPGPIDSLSASAKTAMLYSGSGTTKSAGAYGTRVLYSGYTGPVMNIRNGTGNATLDFYADAAGNLGTAFLGKGTSLATWLNGGTAYVTIWYDQTGNANHATQTTTTLQPVYNQTNKYVDFGATTTGGQAGAYFNLPPGTVPYNNSSYTVVTKHGTLNTVGSSSGFSIGILGAGLGATNLQNNSFGISNGNRNYTNWWYNNDANSAGVYVPNNVVTFTYLSNSTGSTRAIFLNGTTSAVSITGNTLTQNISPASPHYLGTNQIDGVGVSSALNGPLYYMYIAPSVLPTADRLILEST
jgi:hypothetical protein